MLTAIAQSVQSEDRTCPWFPQKSRARNISHHLQRATFRKYCERNVKTCRWTLQKRLRERERRKKKLPECFWMPFPSTSSNPYKHRMCSEVHLKYVAGLRVERTSDAGKLSCVTALSCLVEPMNPLKAKAVMDLEEKKKKERNCNTQEKKKKDVLFAFSISDFPAWTV